MKQVRGAHEEVTTKLSKLVRELQKEVKALERDKKELKEQLDQQAIRLISRQSDTLRYELRVYS